MVGSVLFATDLSSCESLGGSCSQQHVHNCSELGTSEFCTKTDYTHPVGTTPFLSSACNFLRSWSVHPAPVEEFKSEAHDILYKTAL